MDLTGEDPRPTTDMEAACDGCGLTRRVVWIPDPPDDIDPGGYCADCRRDLGLSA